jgi:hypothetical protein
MGTKKFLTKTYETTVRDITGLLQAGAEGVNHGSFHPAFRSFTQTKLYCVLYRYFPGRYRQAVNCDRQIVGGLSMRAECRGYSDSWFLCGSVRLLYPSMSFNDNHDYFYSYQSKTAAPAVEKCGFTFTSCRLDFNSSVLVQTNSYNQE